MLFCILAVPPILRIGLLRNEKSNSPFHRVGYLVDETLSSPKRTIHTGSLPCILVQMRILIIITFLLTQFQLSAQPFHSNKILGTWELQTTEDDEPDDLARIEIPGVENESSTNITLEITLFFQANNVLDFIQSGSQFKAQYQIQDSALFLGTTEYKIIELTSTELVIINENGLSPTTYKYERSDKKVEPIKEIESVKEFYLNGQLKIQGTNERGYRSGIWTEWYDNGKVKKVSHFNNEALLMKIEFDSLGKITSKTRLNFQTYQYIEE
jgi:hypothetical protein